MSYQPGIIRPIDELGRVPIPKEIRRILGGKECKLVKFWVDPETKVICIQKYTMYEGKKQS